MLCRLHQQVCLIFYAVSISKCDFYTVSSSSASVTSMLCRLHNQFDCFARSCSPASVASMLCRLHQQVCLLFYAVSISKCVFYAHGDLSSGSRGGGAGTRPPPVPAKKKKKKKEEEEKEKNRPWDSSSQTTAARCLRGA